MMTNEEIISFLLKRIEEEAKWIASGEISEKIRFYGHDNIASYNTCLNFLKDESVVVENFKYFEYGAVIFYDLVETYQFTVKTDKHTMGCWDCPCFNMVHRPRLSCNLMPASDEDMTPIFAENYHEVGRPSFCPLIKVPKEIEHD